MKYLVAAVVIPTAIIAGLMVGAVMASFGAPVIGLVLGGAVAFLPCLAVAEW